MKRLSLRLLMSLLSLFAAASMAVAAVNLNTATVAELDAVNGIGPSKASAIVEYRNKNGQIGRAHV